MKKEKKNKKRGKVNIKHFSLLLFFIEEFILFRKTYLEKPSSYICITIFVLQFFVLQVISNTAMKHQPPYRFALVLKTP